MHKKEFFDQISHDWDKEHSTPEEQERTRQFAQRFDLAKGETVLDVGCGTGRLIPFIKEKVGDDGVLVEMDLSEGMLQIGNRKHDLPGLYFVQADAHHLCLKENRFSTIICMAFFPHLNDNAGALAEFRRILKPGGTLMVTHQMSREELNEFHKEVKGPVTKDLLPDEAGMRALFSGAGFKDLTIRDEPSLYIARAIA